MTLPAWPSSLPRVPLLPEGSSAPYQAPLETEMEDGPGRARRQATATWSELSLSFKLTSAQFATFEAFARDTLQHGAARFAMPVWRPGATLPLPVREVRLTAPYSWRPMGPRIVVTLPLSVRDY